jgi:DNA-binding GntR family transcriptional regulator
MNSNVFARIEQRTVQHEVVDLIRDAILRGDLEWGEHLNETTMSEQMAVSRIPIREALRQLEQEGLITRIPNRGCFVITFDEKDILEVFSLRATLESMAIEWAISHLAAQDIAELRATIEAQGQAVAAGDYAQLAQLDMKFHEFICIKAQHERLLKAWYAHHAQCQLLLNRRFRTMSDYTPETVVRDHTKILDAIARGDATEAATLTRDISERVAHECVALIKAQTRAISH